MQLFVFCLHAVTADALGACCKLRQTGFALDRLRLALGRLRPLVWGLGVFPGGVGIELARRGGLQLVFFCVAATAAGVLGVCCKLGRDGRVLARLRGAMDRFDLDADRLRLLVFGVRGISLVVLVGKTGLVPDKLRLLVLGLGAAGLGVFLRFDLGLDRLGLGGARLGVLVRRGGLVLDRLGGMGLRFLFCLCAGQVAEGVLGGCLKPGLLVAEAVVFSRLSFVLVKVGLLLLRAGQVDLGVFLGETGLVAVRLGLVVCGLRAVGAGFLARLLGFGALGLYLRWVGLVGFRLSAADLGVFLGKLRLRLQRLRQFCFGSSLGQHLGVWSFLVDLHKLRLGVVLALALVLVLLLDRLLRCLVFGDLGLF